MTTPAILWFRRDLRLADNPALLAAADAGPVLPVFVLDPPLIRPAGPARLAMLYRTLRTLERELHERGATLTVRIGDPALEIPRLAAEIGAGEVHVAADFGPYGSARDATVEANLRDVALVRTGSPYAVAPGRVRGATGEPYRVFTPFYRAWRHHGWRRPAAALPPGTRWHHAGGEPIPDDPAAAAELQLPEAGEAAATALWHRFRDEGLCCYASHRNTPAIDGTSHLSVHLKFGTIHPRTLLAEVGAQDDAFARQLAWREFYAAVLHFWPHSARRSFQPAMDHLPWSTGAAADEQFTAWCSGRTGYPLVDAGMRQLAATGWMHNRVRMVTASFLIKDLHIDWIRGARHFMRLLADGDLANNQHGWQWVAGTGTDAAPFHRILNPITQSERFDPTGEYIRRWVPELGAVPARQIHQPWRLPSGPPDGYPAPIVDHAAERRAALDAYQRAKNP